ncbi:MAG: phosphate ABC transporter substrate-binding protein [Clostridia bacterium]|nr:phosphate ABC transporter substrate-binding protein [Clostridia bacterium]NCC44831.1 phosphate ABC transporter substrate-binding protein [Clostridia bacterium]
MKKRWLAVGSALMLSATMLAGCGNDAGSDTTATTPEATEEAAADDAAADDAAAEETEGGSFEGLISPVSREEGSGTRGAFIELFGIETKDDAGNKIDNTTEMAEITNSTSVMLTTVQGNEYAIGYVSLGSLNDTVKALNIDGAEATVDNIKSGTYKVSRPFNIVTKEGLSDVAADFVNYIMSEEGQAVVEENGYISEGNQGAYESAGVTGKVTVAGSSSVTPVMEKLKEAYVALNPDVEVEVQQSDSTTGVTSAIEGICDIGMASRELKDTETSEGVTGTAIALDGIAVIVNQGNPISDLSTEQVCSIFTGETQDWADIQ